MLDMTQNELVLDEKQGDATKKTDVSPIDLLVKIFRESYDKGNLEEAFQTAQKILAIDEKNFIVWFFLGQIYRNKRFAQFDPREALNCFSKAQELTPRADVAKILGSHFRIGIGTEITPDKAFKYYLQAKELGTTDSEVWYQLGYCYETAFGTEKNPNEAFVCYKKATEVNDKALPAWIKLAECYEKGIGTLPNLQEEIRCRKIITELDGKNAKSWNDLGCLYTKEDKPFYAQAFECFKKATEIEDKFAAAWNNLGNVCGYVKSTPPIEAMKCYKKAISCDPTYIPTLNNLGICYFERKEVALAFPFFQRITQLDPMFATALFNLGFCNLEANQYYPAFNCFRRATEVNAEFTRAWEELAFCYQKGVGTQYNPDEVEKCLLKAGWTASSSASSSSPEERIMLRAPNKKSSNLFMGHRLIIKSQVQQEVEIIRRGKASSIPLPQSLPEKVFPAPTLNSGPQALLPSQSPKLANAPLIFNQNQRSSPPTNNSPTTHPSAFLPPSAPSDAMPLTRSGERNEHLSVLELRDKEIQLWKQQNENLQQMLALKEREIALLKTNEVNLRRGPAR